MTLGNVYLNLMRVDCPGKTDILWDRFANSWGLKILLEEVDFFYYI